MFLHRRVNQRKIDRDHPDTPDRMLDRVENHRLIVRLGLRFPLRIGPKLRLYSFASNALPNRRRLHPGSGAPSTRLRLNFVILEKLVFPITLKISSIQTEHTEPK